jgi:Rnl2 family RNA ligase
MNRNYDRERIRIKLNGGIFHFTYHDESSEKGYYLCDELSTDIFSDATSERLIIFQLQRLWDTNCAISLVFAFVWRKEEGSESFLKVELRDSVSILPIKSDFDATFVTSDSFTTEEERQKIINSYFQGKQVRDGVLDDHQVVPIMMNAARITKSLPKHMVEDAHTNFMQEYNQYMNPPYCESDMSSLPAIPQMSPNQNQQFMFPEPLVGYVPSPGMGMMQQPQAPTMMNFNQNMNFNNTAQIMSSPQAMLQALQSMMQMIVNNQNMVNQPMSPQPLQAPHSPLQMPNANDMNSTLSAQNSPIAPSSLMTPMGMPNMEYASSPTNSTTINSFPPTSMNSFQSSSMNTFQSPPPSPYQPQQEMVNNPYGNMNVPLGMHMNLSGMNYPNPYQFNFPMTMPTLNQKPEYAYVDVPCAALPYRFYSKIFRHIAHSYIDRLVYQKDYHHEKYLWVATEKVKGFSMSMITDGINISIGSRSEILSTKEHYDKFPEWFGVFQPYFAKLLQTFKYCNEKHFPGLRSLQVFVELFGGEYPHKDVEPIPYNKPIVREDPVYYAPDYHLYAFDVYINGDFIPFNQTLDILESNDWLHAKVLAAGTFEEIMNFDVDNLKSFIPASFNLPDKEGNIAEGIVLRMLHHTRRFKKKRDIHGLKCAEPQKVEYFTQKQERLLKIGRGFFTVGRLFENLRNQAPEHVELWAKTYPSRLVGRLLADGCKRFRTEYQEEIRDAWIKKRVPFGRYFKPHVQKVVEAYIKAFQDGSDISGESSNDSGDSRSQ